MSPHTPDAPPPDRRRSTPSRDAGRRAIRRLRQLGSDVGASLGRLADDLSGRPPVPATVPVAPSPLRRHMGGGR